MRRLCTFRIFLESTCLIFPTPFWDRGSSARLHCFVNLLAANYLLKLQLRFVSAANPCNQQLLNEGATIDESIESRQRTIRPLCRRVQLRWYWFSQLVKSCQSHWLNATYQLCLNSLGEELRRTWSIWSIWLSQLYWPQWFIEVPSEYEWNLIGHVGISWDEKI